MQASFFLLFGLSALALGSHLLVNSLKAFSLYFHLKPLFLSIVVLGFVSSSPEYFVTLLASFKNLPDAAVGNIFGSNIINILLVLALTGLFYKGFFDKQIARFEMPVLIASMACLFLFLIDEKLSSLEAGSLILIFSCYLVVLFRKRKNEQAESVLPVKDFSLFKASRDLILGFIILFAGSSLVINSSLQFVEIFHLSERFAGVFILSLSTSLPELATSFQAVFKKEGGMALGNVVGSNLFNTLFVLGSAGIINPLRVSSELYYDCLFMFLVTLVLWFSLLFFKKIPRWVFCFFIVSYFFYIAFVSGVLN